MNVLVTGAGGQLGQDLVRVFSSDGCSHCVAASHTDLDVGDRDQTLGVITTLAPDVVVHAAAWTAVDACEADPDRAWRTNTLGCRHVADACAQVGAHLCAISTDYVFDGCNPAPYTEWDAVNPLSVYGRSKLGGEREILTRCPGAAVVRSSWLCGEGGPNFVKTMVRLAAGSGTVPVVNDQHGCPTFTADLADLIRRLVASRLPGVFHATNAGATTWFGLAREVFTASGADADRVVPISTAELDPPRPAPRPANSMLDNAALRLSDIRLLPDYRESLERLVKELRT